MRRIVAGAVLLVVGAVMIGSAYGSMSDDADYLEQNGASVPGEVIAAAGDGVTVEFQLSQERLQATAHPTNAESFTVGEFVMVSVLRDDPTRIVIQGTSESPPLGAIGVAVLGGFVVIAGVGTILMSAAARDVAGRLSPLKWKQERHGGA